MEKELVYGPIENNINGPDLRQHELKEFCCKMSLKWYEKKTTANFSETPFR